MGGGVPAGRGQSRSGCPGRGTCEGREWGCDAGLPKDPGVSSE